MKLDRQNVRLLVLTISFLLFPIIIFYFSPYLVVLGAFQGVLAAAGIMFAIQLVAAIVLRRAPCGWVCPVGGLQDIEAKSIDKPFSRKRLDLMKWVIWVPWVASIVAGFIVAGGGRKVDFFFHTDHGISVSDLMSLAIYFAIVAIFFIPNIFLGRRSMCHSICWMAPFMIIGSRIGKTLHLPQLHVSSVTDACIHCGKCDRACPMSLPVESLQAAGEIADAECIQCGACCDACPKDVLRLRVSKMGCTAKEAHPKS